MKINYYHYHFSKLEWLRYLAEAAGICVAVNYLCYQAIWAYLFIAPFALLYLKWKKKSLILSRRERLGRQFKEAVHSLSVALNAGYSMENAIGECIKELKNLYAVDEPIVQEFLFIQSQIRVSMPVESLFIDLGNRSGLEDIQNFASVYAIAKRTGGNLSSILSRSASIITEKIETTQEITASIAAKKLEQTVMSIVPCGIIIYMNLTSPGFLDVLYGSAVGVMIMTICLLFYGMAYRMGKKLVEIEV